MNKRILITASLLGALAVVLGAFGAHGLKTLIDDYSLSIWEKGVTYQFYHVFALLFLSLIKTDELKIINAAYWFFTTGIVLFSGSLYLLASRSILKLEFVNYVGPVTPIGGLLFILGWVFLSWSALKQK